jgi:hypothetical protein
MIKIVLILLVSSLISCSSAFSCTMFTFTNNGKTYFCNNEDNPNPDIEIRFYPSENGKYAWVYLGNSNDWAQGGVNEKGLCWDWWAGFTLEDWKEDSTKITINGNPSETMIAKCATVDEAIGFYEKHNEPGFSYGRIMITDKSGNSVIIGWKDGKMSVTRKYNDLFAQGYRGNVVESYFSNIQGEKDLRYLTGALSAAHQNGKSPTQYSNIICLNDGKIILYKYCNFDEFVELDYTKILKNGFTVYKISDLFDEKRKMQDVLIVKNDSSSFFGSVGQNYNAENYTGYYYTGDRFFLIVEQSGKNIIYRANDYSNYVSPTPDTLYKTSNDTYENINTLFKFSDRTDYKFNKVLACWYGDAFTYQRALLRINEKLAENYIGIFQLNNNTITTISFSDENLLIKMSNQYGVIAEYPAKMIDDKNLIFSYGRIAFDEKVDSKYQQINFVSNKTALFGKRIK